MTVKTWWDLIDVIDKKLFIPVPVFIIRCNGCGEEFEALSLQKLPQECPDCGKRNEVQ